MSLEVENKTDQNTDVEKKKKRYLLWGKIVLGIGVVLLLVGFIGFIVSSMEFMEDFFDDDDGISPIIFMIPFVLGMFCMAGGSSLLALGRGGKLRNMQAHTIIINESSTEPAPEPKEEKKGGKCQNCGAPYKADEKTCKYCGSDL